jgi:hypothetical protein
MLPTLEEAIQFFIDYGNIHGTVEQCLNQWPPSVGQLFDATTVARRAGRPNHEVDRMCAAIIFGKK